MFIKKLALILILSAFPLYAHAQSATPAATPFENAWTVSVNGNFSSLQSQGTNNGVLLSTAIKLSTHWNLRADTYIMQSPNITIVLGSPEYRFSLASLFKSTAGAVNPANVEVFVNGGLGDAKATAVLSQVGNTTTTQSSSKFAASVGGGFDIMVTPTMSIRPLDVKYIRSSMITNGGQFVGNHLDFAAGLGLRF